MAAIEKDLDVDSLLIEGDLKTIFTWLKNNIHHYSGSIPTQEMILKVTNEPFNPDYYVNYLISKYSSLLGIEVE